MRAQKKSYIIRIPVDAAEIPVLFGRGSARRSISAILTTTVTTTTIHALVRPDNGNRDCGTRNPKRLGRLSRSELPNIEREPRTVHLSSFVFLPLTFASWREILAGSA